MRLSMLLVACATAQAQVHTVKYPTLPAATDFQAASATCPVRCKWDGERLRVEHMVKHGKMVAWVPSQTPGAHVNKVFHKCYHDAVTAECKCGCAQWDGDCDVGGRQCPTGCGHEVSEFAGNLAENANLKCYYGSDELPDSHCYAPDRNGACAVDCPATVACPTPAPTTSPTPMPTRAPTPAPTVAAFPPSTSWDNGVYTPADNEELAWAVWDWCRRMIHDGNPDAEGNFERVIYNVDPEKHANRYRRFATYSMSHRSNSPNPPDRRRTSVMKLYGEIGTWDLRHINDVSRLFAKSQERYGLGARSYDYPGNICGGKAFHHYQKQPGMVQTKYLDNTLAGIENWDTSNVIDMSSLVGGNQRFNAPIGKWNTGKVISMQSMFAGSNDFNQPIDDWDVSNVINMRSMFQTKKIARGVKGILGDLSKWDISKLQTADGMFHSARLPVYSMGIHKWDVSGVWNVWQMMGASLAAPDICDRGAATDTTWPNGPGPNKNGCTAGYRSVPQKIGDSWEKKFAATFPDDQWKTTQKKLEEWRLHYKPKFALKGRGCREVTPDCDGGASVDEVVRYLTGYIDEKATHPARFFMTGLSGNQGLYRNPRQFFDMCKASKRERGSESCAKYMPGPICDDNPNNCKKKLDRNGSPICYLNKYNPGKWGQDKACGLRTMQAKLEPWRFNPQEIQTKFENPAGRWRNAKKKNNGIFSAENMADPIFRGPDNRPDSSRCKPPLSRFLRFDRRHQYCNQTNPEWALRHDKDDAHFYTYTGTAEWAAKQCEWDNRVLEIDGKINLQEFQEATYYNYGDKRKMAASMKYFKMYDTDSDGFLSVPELKAIPGEDCCLKTPERAWNVDSGFLSGKPDWTFRVQDNWAAIVSSSPEAKYDAPFDYHWRAILHGGRPHFGDSSMCSEKTPGGQGATVWTCQTSSVEMSEKATCPFEVGESWDWIMAPETSECPC